MSIYKFVNVTKNIDDVAKNTDILNIGIISLFESVINANEWNTQDVIMAFPEKKSNPILRYQNGDIELNTDCDKKNCTYCGDILDNDMYGNICEKHIPSYALWDNEYKHRYQQFSKLKKMHVETSISVDAFTKALDEFGYDREAFDEELSERRLAIELDLLDYGQDDYDCEQSNYDHGQDNYDYDDGYGYEDECEAESFY